MTASLTNSLRKTLALALALMLSATQAAAGLLVRGTSGISMTGADGVRYEGVNGISMTGADGLLGLTANGITWPSLVGDAPALAGAAETLYTGANILRVAHSDGISMTGADGISMTGADGISMTGADGVTHLVSSVLIRQPAGISMTGADGISMTGADGISMTGADGISMTGADGISMTGADMVRVVNAVSVIAVGTDGRLFPVTPDGISMTGADGISMTGADGISMTGADGIVLPVVDAATQAVGLQGFDPELALLLERATDDSGVGAVVIFHRMPTDADFAALRRVGVIGGTRFRRLPFVVVTATRRQLIQISQLPAVRSIWGNRTLRWNDARANALTGAERLRADGELSGFNNNLQLTGRGVTVAVLDTGLDATHADIAGRVAKNVKLADVQGLPLLGFRYPLNVEGLWNTDLLSGHGTFVSGVVAGSGARSGGRHAGVAPGARLVGLSAGDANLFFVLAGFDYLLERGASLGVRVVNCSFSANTVYDENDPVNVATKMLTNAGVNVVFSAGNEGPGAGTLNPYAAAPWVVSVGGTDARGRLAPFSSRGTFASAAHRPTVVAPATGVVSLRAGGLLGTTSLNGLLSGADAQQLSGAELLYYTTGSGTSFSAPQVAGTIALMLEANPRLTPAEVRHILQRTATPLPPHYAHEVGAGMLNVHAAVLEAAFPARRIGLWRAALERGQVRFVVEPAREFAGTARPGAASDTSLTIPSDTVHASVRVAWGPLLTANDLGLKLYDGGGALRAHVNYLNLPGLTGRVESAELESPAAGTWRARVFHTIGALGGSQPYVGTLRVARAEHAPLRDLGALSEEERDEVRRALRTFVMLPFGEYFHPHLAASRAELAATLVRAGRVPQYAPGRPTYSDVRGAELLSFVESAQSAPAGPLFPDAYAGGTFRPDEAADRLVAAVALVRAAGLRAEAEGYSGAPPDIADLSAIPAELHGYVAVALARGLLAADAAGSFRPHDPLTRAQLAHAAVAVIRIASE